MKKQVKNLAMAALIATSLNVKAAEITISPTATVVWAAVSVVMGLETSVEVSGNALASSIDPRKEEVRAIKGDALNFLAGDEATDVLNQILLEIRSQDESFIDLSDVEIAALIIEVLQ